MLVRQDYWEDIRLSTDVPEYIKLGFISEPKDSLEVWKTLILYCRKSRRLIELYHNHVPDDDAEEILQTSYDKEEICRIILKMGSPLETFETLPLRRPEVGIVGTPVYSYKTSYEDVDYYIALTEIDSGEKLKIKIFLKSLKLYDESYHSLTQD